ncbi:hypothetical protein CHUAL_010052 [Chamberlinius hualienensis]
MACLSRTHIFGKYLTAGLSTSCSHFKQHLPLTNLSEEESMFKETVGKLAQEKIKPLVKKMDEQGRLNKECLDCLFGNGLMGIEIASKYGGAGSSFFMSILAIQEMSKVDTTVGGLIDMQNTVVNTLLQKFGTEEQKNKYLPMLAQKHLGSFCLSEPDAGSDAFGLKTRADKQGDCFVINGTKRWITNAREAKMFLVFANLNPDSGYKGVTCFLVDEGTKGLNVDSNYDKLGIRATSTCEVIFDNVKVYENSILGGIGGGYKCAISILNEGRIGIGAQMLGSAEGCMNIAIPYTMERKQFGQRIFEFQAMQHQIAYVSTQIECARLLIYNAARMRENGQSIVKEAAMAKLFSSEVAQLTASKCIDWMGGVGFTKDYPLEKFYRDVKAGTIYEGTSNIQLNTIAKVIGQSYRAK